MGDQWDGAGETFDPNTSILEDFLESVTPIPIELKRTAILLREVDARCQQDLIMLKKSQDEHLEAISKNAPNTKDLGALVDVHKKRLDVNMEEKTAIISQIEDILDKHVGRLHRDLRNFQGFLRSTGELEESGLPDPFAPIVGPKPVVVPPQAFPPQSIGGIPAGPSASGHGPPTAPTPPARQRSGGGGAIDTSKYALGAWVAARSPSDPSSWIMARIVDVNSSTGLVTIADVENESERTTLPPSRLVLMVENEDVAAAKARLGSVKNRMVMAVYPDTTTFYSAKVVQQPFKVNVNDPDPNVAGKVCIGCHFNDDEDPPGSGITPKRIVPVRAVFIP